MPSIGIWLCGMDREFQKRVDLFTRPFAGALGGGGVGGVGGLRVGASDVLPDSFVPACCGFPPSAAHSSGLQTFPIQYPCPISLVGLPPRMVRFFFSTRVGCQTFKFHSAWLLVLGFCILWAPDIDVNVFPTSSTLAPRRVLGPPRFEANLLRSARAGRLRRLTARLWHHFWVTSHLAHGKGHLLTPNVKSLWRPPDLYSDEIAQSANSNAFATQLVQTQKRSNKYVQKLGKGLQVLQDNSCPQLRKVLTTQMTRTRGW